VGGKDVPTVEPEGLNVEFDPKLDPDELLAETRALAVYGERLRLQSRYEAAVVVCGAVVDWFRPGLTTRLRGDFDKAVEVVRSTPPKAGGVRVAILRDGPRLNLAAADPETCQFVAYALVNMGLALEGLDRDDAALEAYEELVARFGDTQHALTLVRVAWAMYDKAAALWRLERDEEAMSAFDAVIAKFADATDPRIQPRVSWSLWHKSSLLEKAGRREEMLTEYERLIARQDELIDPELGDIVAWCMSEVADALLAGSRNQDALRVYGAMADRFGPTSDEKVRMRLPHAFARKAYLLETVGQDEEAIAFYDEILERFRDDSDVRVRELLADGLTRKARLLARTERDAEAVVIFNSAASAYHELVKDQGEQALGSAVSALLHKAVSVCKIDAANSSAVVDQLSEVLGDVTKREPAPDCPPSEPLSEKEVAAILARLYTGDCWQQFATSGDDPSALATMENQALALYDQTSGWLRSAHDGWDTPALGAVMLIRQIADGHALLTRAWSKTWRASLSLPSSLLLEFAMRRFGIAEWAAEHGHPIELPDSTDLAEELIESERELGEQWEPDLAAAFVASARHYEMLELLCDSPSGRTALHTPPLKNFASLRINEARKLASWTWQLQEDAAGLAAAGIFIAQAYFVATHGTISSSHDLFPSRKDLRDMLRETGAYPWLHTEDVDLPEWLDAAEE
jgi:tetratricopeptide (TPR) repeat protein